MGVLNLSKMSLLDIQKLICKDWHNVYFGAVPYLKAMAEIDSNGMYYLDGWQSIVIYFLSNAKSWRGDTARAVKAELMKRYKSDKMNGDL